MFAFLSVGIDDVSSSICFSSAATAAALLYRDYSGFHGLEGCEDRGVGAHDGGMGRALERGSKSDLGRPVGSVTWLRLQPRPGVGIRPS